MIVKLLIFLFASGFISVGFWTSILLLEEFGVDPHTLLVPASMQDGWPSVIVFFSLYLVVWGFLIKRAWSKTIRHKKTAI